MRVETARPSGPDTWVVGLVGTQTERFRSVILSASDLKTLRILEPTCSYTGDGHLLRLGLQAYALGIAQEYDPYFGLSISRVDPLPHQLDAVYNHLLKSARCRFLLADDAGAGKTIMSGLLLKELKFRGLVERMLIICPANLAFQWQREMGDFRKASTSCAAATCACNMASITGMRRRTSSPRWIWQSARRSFPVCGRPTLGFGDRGRSTPHVGA